MTVSGRTPASDFAKRLVDVCVSGALLVLTLPVQVAVAAAVGAQLGRPVIFQQRRPGQGGHPFTLYKFRTMLPEDAALGRVDDADRMTRLGGFLRSSSLDELPTLWNVLKGDMSLVGPRPLLMEYLELYTPEQARRHEVRPGVTGLAQVSGRNAISWEQKLALDVEYVERRNLALDLRILVGTVRSVVARKGISHDGHVTMTKFGGSR